MSTQSSPLTNILKKSLTVQTSGLKEAYWDWNEAAKSLHEAYASLVKLHDSIEPLLREEWPEIAQSYKALTNKMLALEKKTIGADDQERQKSTKAVQQLILEAESLEKAIRAEPARRQAEMDLRKEYIDRASRVAELLQYTVARKLEKTSPFSELSQAKSWVDSGSPTTNQMSSVIKTVDKVEEQVKQRNAEEEKVNKAAREKKQRDDEEAQRLEAVQKKSAEALKQQKIALQAKADPVEALLVNVIKAVAAEAAAYEKLNNTIATVESKLDKKQTAFQDRLDELKRRIAKQNQSALLNKGYKALAPSGSGFTPLEGALRDAKLHLAEMSISELETLERDLNKVLENMDALADDRPALEDALRASDPALIKKRETNPKVRAFVFADELPIANGDLNDVVGILGGERAGRTSPSGNANHVHVGGNAQNNAIFDWGGAGGAVRLLGFVNGHMDRNAPPPVLNEAARVERRAGGTFTEVEVDLMERTLRPLEGD